MVLQTSLKSIRSGILLKILFLAGGLFLLIVPVYIGSVTPMERVFRIEAKSFAYSPGQISVNPGDRVTIKLMSTDVVHGFYLDGYGISTEADPGQTATISFVADKAGSFRFRCNVTCGAMHPFMIGKINVGHNNVLLRSVGLALSAIALLLFWKPGQGSR